MPQRWAMCICIVLAAFSFAPRAAAFGPAKLDLNGQWQLTQGAPDPAPAEESATMGEPLGEGGALAGTINAVVPGCVHTDLLAAGKIPDPFFRDNERNLQWIGETAWIYRRHFAVAADLLHHRHVHLVCQGLDTLATIAINGKTVAHTDNMFRTWEFDAAGYLHAGDNQIEITFDSTFPYMKSHQVQAAYPGLEVFGTGYVRKEPCNYGWDWGPTLITAGIWKPIYLLAYDDARWADVGVTQDHHTKGIVRLGVDLSADVDPKTAVLAEVAVSFHDQVVAQASVPLANVNSPDISPGLANGHANLIVDDPQLWWPAGMGPQNLYEVQCTLRLAKATDGSSPGPVIDVAHRRIGLRTIDWLAKTESRPLGLAVNGRPFFAKGASWIPCETFATRTTPAALRRYVADAVAVNMNMMRFWGGGYYEDDALFDACDEMGVLIWLDCKFANAGYPMFDPAFVENIRAEARDQVLRLRNHPSIAVWCGNNEVNSFFVADVWGTRNNKSQMSRADYERMFNGVIADAVHELVPLAPYTPGSPESGDQHNWSVWHGRKPFENYEKSHGMMTEFGFQSFPNPATVEDYTEEADRSSVLSPMMVWHQRNWNKIGDSGGNAVILQTLLRYFRQPKDFDSTLWVSQINQAYAMKIGVEHWRRDWPASTGSLIWQYDDCWPVASWSSVDYFGRWKALHYTARHFFEPLLVTAIAHNDPQDADYGDADLFVCNDRAKAASGTIHWRATDTAGATLLSGQLDVNIPAGTSSTHFSTLPLADTLRRVGPGNVLLWLDLSVDGQSASRNLVFFTRPGHLQLVDPQLQPTVSAAGDSYAVTLTAAHPALWTWLELKGDPDARFSDNFVHINADQSITITITPSHSISLDAVRAGLRARSLFDTYGPAATEPATEPSTQP